MQGVPNRWVPPVASEEVWRTAKRPQSPPLGARGVFPCAWQESSQMPRPARPGSRARRGAGEVLAAIVSTPADRRAPRESGDVENETVAAGDGCRGEVPRATRTSPPQGAAPRSLRYPPTELQRVARAGGLKGTFLNPAKLVCMHFSKNGLPAKTARRAYIGAIAGRHPGPLGPRRACLQQPQIAYPTPEAPTLYPEATTLHPK